MQSLWVCAWCSMHVVHVAVMPRWFFSVKWFSRGVKINSFSLSLMLRWHRTVHMNLNTPAEHHNINAATQMPEKIVSSYHTLDYVKCQQFQSLVTPNSQRVACTEICTCMCTWFRYFCGECVFTLNETLSASVSNVHRVRFVHLWLCGHFEFIDHLFVLYFCMIIDCHYRSY